MSVNENFECGSVEEIVTSERGPFVKLIHVVDISYLPEDITSFLEQAGYDMNVETREQYLEWDTEWTHSESIYNITRYLVSAGFDKNIKLLLKVY